MLLLNSLAILVAGVGFVAALEGWRRWSENRRIRKHFQHYDCLWISRRCHPPEIIEK
jgi:hypothetical protein